MYGSKGDPSNLTQVVGSIGFPSGVDLRGGLLVAVTAGVLSSERPQKLQRQAQLSQLLLHSPQSRGPATPGEGALQSV